MSGHLKAAAIVQLCQAVEDRVCNTVDCEHVGRGCEAVACENRVCNTHGHYCSGCELRYCEECYEAHLEVCCGPRVDVHDQQVEQALALEIVLPGADREQKRGSQ
jgi:hypothetical protein